MTSYILPHLVWLWPRAGRRLLWPVYRWVGHLSWWPPTWASPFRRAGCEPRALEGSSPLLLTCFKKQQNPPLLISGMWGFHRYSQASSEKRHPKVASTHKKAPLWELRLRVKGLQKTIGPHPASKTPQKDIRFLFRNLEAKRRAFCVFLKLHCCALNICFLKIRMWKS